MSSRTYTKCTNLHLDVYSTLPSIILCSCLIFFNICCLIFIFALCENNYVPNVPLHRQSVLNVQQGFTVLALWMLKQGMCLVLAHPRCVLKDTTAHQVGCNSAAISETFMTNVQHYQILLPDINTSGTQMMLRAQ